ncbi:phthiocerol/phthiodiolone dimycocerosyl transferase family protein [Nocardia sp. NBC_00416]|uniref:phthiocerol/phthiodiolone dimycocerosyl transferase family protein n=1 Tax=Nocardia sp. NBC_00416 TaxID=2975991 RepID=UPI002E1AE1C4
MTAATVIRPLAPSEQIFAFSEVFVGYCARVSGPLDLSALTSAFEALVTAHPMLGAQLAPTEPTGHTLVTSGPPEIVLTVADGDPEMLLTGAEPDQRRALGTVHVVRSGTTAGVTLLVHHSIADATHALKLLEQLWHCYAAAAAGRVPFLAPTRQPLPVEDLLAARGVVRRPVPGGAEPPRIAPPLPPADALSANEERYPPLITTRCRLSREQTGALLAYGRHAGVTVHSLIAAALLLIESEARQLPVDELLCSYSVDLRRRVRPPIGPTEGTNVLGFAGYRPGPGTEATLTALAHGVFHALRAGLASGYIQQTPLQLPDTLAAPPANPFDTVMTTNWGRLPRLPVPNLRIHDFRTTMIAKPDPTGRRPPQAGGGTSIISTYEDRLSVEVHHPPEFTPVQIPRIRHLETLLTRL